MPNEPIFTVEEILAILNTPFPYEGRMITLNLNEFYKQGLAIAIQKAIQAKS